jgi:hypothetical protein
MQIACSRFPLFIFCNNISFDVRAKTSNVPVQKIPFPVCGIHGRLGRLKEAGGSTLGRLKEDGGSTLGSKVGSPEGGCRQGGKESIEMIGKVRQ